MSVSRTNPRRSTRLKDLRHQIAVYIDTLYAERNGWVGCALGGGGHFAPSKSEKSTYSFHFVHHEFFRWPEERSELIDYVMENRKDYDVLICPILQSKESLKKGCAVEGAHAWCDIDLDLDRQPELYEEVEQLLTHGSMIIESGGRGGRHLYVALDRLYPPDIIEKLNRALRDYINCRAEAYTGKAENLGKADNLIATNALLRPPGTLNQKGRATRGHHPYPVRLEDEEYTRAPWTPDKLLHELRVPSSPIRDLKEGSGQEAAPQAHSSPNSGRCLCTAVHTFTQAAESHRFLCAQGKRPVPICPALRAHGCCNRGGLHG